MKLSNILVYTSNLMYYVLCILEPKSCVITKEDLKDNMRVLIFMEGLFYEGDVKEIEPPDM